ncbi:MAG: hypothetical protein [Circular genetic element sp.]|nr:MAG: hypothetical protein [Circular genetic element sp.]
MKSGASNLQEKSEHEKELDEYFEDLSEGEEDDEEDPRGYYFWHFRLTLSQDCTTEESRKKLHAPTLLRKKCRPYINKILELYVKRSERKYWTACIEYYNDKGEYTKPHLHFNFTSHHVRDTMIRPLDLIHEAQVGFPLRGSGNAYFSLKPCAEVNYDKWRRYALKQLPTGPENTLNLTPAINHGGLENQTKMWQRAHDQWILGCEVNQSKASHKKTKEERYDRIERFLKKNKEFPPPTTIPAVALGIIEFYIKEKSPVNSNTIQGYTTTYCLKEGLLSVATLSENIAKKIMG